MAERIVSPGVFTRENDMSFLAQGVGEIGAAFVGPFKQGPGFVPTVVRTQSEFEEIFGVPDGTFYTEYTVQQYLRESGTATVVRVMGLGGYTHAAPVGIFVESGSDKFLAATLFSTNNGDEEVGFPNTLVTDLESGSFGISGSELGTTTTASVYFEDTNSINSVFGTSPIGDKNAYVYAYFPYAVNVIDSTKTDITVSREILPTQDFSYDAQRAHTPWVVSQDIAGERYNLFRFHTIGHGNVYNRKFKISISDVRAAGTGTGTDFSTFTVMVRSFSDTDRRQSVLETYNNVNLDPNSPNYIARVIGDQYYDVDANGKIHEHGDWSSRSRLIYAEVSEPDTYPISAAPFGHAPYYNPIATATHTDVPPVVYQESSNDNTTTSRYRFSGIDLESINVRRDNHQYLNSIPDNAQVGSNGYFALDGGNLNLSLSSTEFNDIVLRQFTIAFQYGFDGKSPSIVNAKGSAIVNTNSQGFDLSTVNASGSQAYIKAIRTLSNADEWDINMLATPGVVGMLHPSVLQAAVDMVERRGDLFYITDLAGVDGDILEVVDEASRIDSNYVATYYPWIRIIDNNTNKLISVPPSVLMPAVFAANDRISAEWFPPAGLTRGGVIGAVSVMDRLNHTDRNVLYEGKVNPIATFPGQGIVAWGQKTLQDKASALDRINVRRLLINLKKFIASTSRFLVFEQNTAVTRARFINTVTPYMEAVQQRQGLYTFRVVMDESNNTPDVIDRNILTGQIFLQPTRTAEFIVIDFNILPTGGGAVFGD